MSMKSWIKEFYPSAPQPGWTGMRAAKHSLRKWEGALLPNLRRHGVVYQGWTVSNRDRQRDGRSDLFFSYMSCALCVKFLLKDCEDPHPCRNCPLSELQGGGCGVAGPYMQSRHRAWPMVRMLRRLVRRLSKRQ
jgi:hypothetical protein